VALNEDHLKELLFKHLPPPAVTSKVETSLIRMGFPQKRTDSWPSLCVCHQVPKYGGYYCPRCGCKFCELPMDCQICGLCLVSSPHLARSYHHLFPVVAFTEIQLPPGKESCFACQKIMGSGTFCCPKCKAIFCNDCDDFIHDSLHNCPGCEMSNRQLEP